MKDGLKYIILFALLAVSACTRYQYVPYQETSLTCPDGTVIECPVEGEVTEDLSPIELEADNSSEGQEVPATATIPEPGEETAETQDVPTVTDEEAAVTPAQDEGEADLVVTEGDLVKLNPKVTDEDGDQVTLTFSAPLDQNGMWQTEIGDAGLYHVTITASDGKATSTKEMTILVKSSNNPPLIQVDDLIEVSEGEMVELDPIVTDPDGDDVELTVSGWMDSLTYQTGYNDAGEYIVTLTASDGKSETTKDVVVIVKNTNRPPVLQLDNVEGGMIEAVEGDAIMIEASAEDPDNDEVLITYSEPFDEDGFWQTEVGDAGQYTVEVVATDGYDVVSTDVLVVVTAENQPPVFDPIPDMTINVGENLQDYIVPQAVDPEGEEVTYEVNGWVDNLDYVLQDADAGEHTINIVYSDGQAESEDTVVITVNRPPVFEI